MVKKLLAFLQPKSSLICSQEPDTGPCPESLELSSDIHLPSILKLRLIILIYAWVSKMLTSCELHMNGWTDMTVLIRGFEFLF